jgi:penicillin-binding protein 1C
MNAGSHRLMSRGRIPAGKLAGRKAGFLVGFLAGFLAAPFAGPWPWRRRLAAAFAGLGLLLGVAYWRWLPRPLFAAPLSYVVEARDGTLLSARIAADGQWRFPPGQDVPARFRRALLVFEDKRFENHSGIDGLAIARAAKLNLRAGRVVSGGSTVTMQLARLSRQGRARSGVRDQRNLGAKLTEALLALRLETAYDKDELLRLYAANAPFGGNVVGLEAASWRYFGREPASLSWAETATLAVLPNNPALVHLKRNRERLQRKRDALLQRLHESGDLTALDLELALSEPLATEPHDLPDLAPHLLDTLRAQDPARHRVRTTLDARLQSQAAQLLNDHSSVLSRQNVHNAAALIVDNTTFEVLAYIGNSNGVTPHLLAKGVSPRSAPTPTDTPLESGPRGHSVDIIRRPRSTGSILKPMLYAAMLEDGTLTPRMLLPDVPTHFEGFSPENFDRQYRGAVPADEALAASLNIPAVRMLRTYGVARFADLLRASGMSTLNRPADDYGLTLILGGAEGNLWDITGLYASLAQISRAGLADPEPQFRTLSAVSGEPGETRAATPIGAGSAWLTMRALLEVPRPGEEGHWRSFADSRAIAWKTGTSWGLRDGWAVGTTSRHTVGVWVGNASGEGRPGLTGSTMAAPLMFGLFNALPASAWFAQPVHALRQIDVCANDGFLAVPGCETERTWLPRDSHFESLSPHNPRVNLDSSGRFRVDSECESPGAMRHANWFVLPPAEEFYYRKSHAEYRPLPALRADCLARGAARGALALLYPDVNGRVLIPGELDGSRGRAVFEAVHRRQDAVIYWHLDDRYLGETHTFHQQSLDIDPGEHILTLVDNEGQRVTRRFEVLSARN